MIRVIAVIVSLALAAPVAAQPAPEAQEGVCLPLEAHQAILADLRELRGADGDGGLRERVRLLQAWQDKAREQMVDLRVSRDLAVQAKDAAQTALESAEAGRRRAEAARDDARQQRVWWLAGGLLGALVLAVTVDKIQE